MSLLGKHVANIRSPLGGEKVYKDECAFSFDTPECEGGLYVCMKTFLGLGRKHVERYYRKTGHAVFLHIRRIKKEIPITEDDPPKKKPTRLAIGVEGGFDVGDKTYEIEELSSVVVLPEWQEYTLSNVDLPGEVQISAATILAADSAAKQEEMAALAGTWDGEKRIISKHAETLHQCENPPKIPPKGWKCQQCDLTDNLWLNMTDGSILCGRKFWDGTGGNNHAVEHYQQCKYPLAVKLGTITPDGADVFSYQEDEMVEDPHLARHLAHFGIDIMSMQKTDKSMLELEIDLNQKVGEWDIIQESGSKLEPIYGPGYTGITNLGNTCYINSVLQILFSIPNFVRKYYDSYQTIIENAPANATNDFTVQMSKLAHGILSGDYSKPPSDVPSGDSNKPIIKYQENIKPRMFRTLVTRGHPSFSTNRQQDAEEFLLHLIKVIERNTRHSDNPCESLQFQVEERLECIQSGRVKYKKEPLQYSLALPIPMEAVQNRAEVVAYEERKKLLEAEKQVIDPKDIVRPRLTLANCFESFEAPEIVDGFYSSALKTTTTIRKTTRFATFPDYLLIQLKKYTWGDDWLPRKLDVSVEVPDELDISQLRGTGLKPGEQELSEEAPEVHIDQEIVAKLVDMGFPLEGCRKGVYHTKNAGVEVAMSWVMEHIGDADFAAPLVLPGSARGSSTDFVANEDHLAMIVSMGFTRDQAVKALKATENNVERAADWIFSHAEELEQPMEAEQPQPDVPGRDGPTKYKLVGFISHMGTSLHVGHYVCHILKEGRWVIFNDEKVALSEHPPKDLAYLYLYQGIH